MAETFGAVTAIWRYPVKSMRGEQPDAVSVMGRCLAGDRAFALIDQTSGKVVSAKHPRLWGLRPQCSASLTTSPDLPDSSPRLWITLPSGRTVPDREHAERLLSGNSGTQPTPHPCLGRRDAAVPGRLRGGGAGRHDSSPRPGSPGVGWIQNLIHLHEANLRWADPRSAQTLARCR
jgi:hypothetical protein